MGNASIVVLPPTPPAVAIVQTCATLLEQVQNGAVEAKAEFEMGDEVEAYLFEIKVRRVEDVVQPKKKAKVSRPKKKERQMTNKERAVAVVKDMDGNYDTFIPTDMSPFREKEYDSFRADVIAHALDKAEERARSANNKVLRETLGNAAMRIWTVYRDLDKVTNVVQREMLYNLNNEIQRVLGDTK